MRRETRVVTATVVVVLDGDTDAGYELSRRLLAEGCQVAAVTRHPGAAVRVMHGQSAERVMVIAADVADERQWSQVIQRVTGRFGRIDTIVRGRDSALRAHSPLAISARKSVVSAQFRAQIAQDVNAS